MFKIHCWQITITQGQTAIVTIGAREGGYIPSPADSALFTVCTRSGKKMIEHTLPIEADGSVILPLMEADTKHMQPGTYSWDLWYLAGIERIPAVPSSAFQVLRADGKAPDPTVRVTAEVFIQSMRGPQGIQGLKGDTGATGERGLQGEQGPKGEPFTYADFTAAQLEALRGPKGDTGATGETGAQGPQGEQGPAGADGTMSFEDLTDAQKESLRGPQGIQGPQGEPGPVGPAGQDGATGEQGPPGIQGQPGQGLPDGGSAGQVLSKASATDYDTEWIDPPSGVGGTGLPAGGVAGDTLVKQSSTDGDAAWETPKHEKLYKTGDIVSTLGESPAARWGGTWEKIKEKFLFGAGDTYIADVSGGNETARLSESNLPGRTVISAPNKTGGSKSISGVLSGYPTVENNSYVFSSIYDVDVNNFNTEYSVHRQPFSIMPPYIAVNIWKCIDDSTVKRVMIE